MLGDAVGYRIPVGGLLLLAIGARDHGNRHLRVQALMQQALDIGFAHDRTTGKEDWLTPPHLLRKLGVFDLDPCSPVGRPWDTAKHHFTILDDGLKKDWFGRVWLNPPYGNLTARWMERLAAHGNGIALIFARTETATFFPWVWEHASAILFVKGRICFYTKEGRVRAARLERRACSCRMDRRMPRRSSALVSTAS